MKCTCGQLDMQEGTMRWFPNPEGLNHSPSRCAKDCACGAVKDLGYALTVRGNWLHTVAECQQDVTFVPDDNTTVYGYGDGK